MFTHCRLCTIKITIPGCLLWLQRHYKLSSEKAMNQIRNPPIQKALLSQRHIGISSSYCELYTKTMYKSKEKKVCCYISVYLLWINIWWMNSDDNSHPQHYDTVTALCFKWWPEAKYMWSKKTPLNDLYKSALYSHIKGLCYQ